MRNWGIAPSSPIPPAPRSSRRPLPHPLQPATGTTRVAPHSVARARPSPPALCSRRGTQLESHPLRAPPLHQPGPSIAPPSAAGDGRNSSRTRCRPRRPFGRGRPSPAPPSAAPLISAVGGGALSPGAGHPGPARDLQRPATGATRVAPVAGQLPCPPSGRRRPRVGLHMKRHASH